jgi:cardiolipin synthase
MAMPDFSFYNRKQYFTDLTQRIAKTGDGDRVALATMSFDPEFPEIRQLVNGLAAAVKRGANVSLAIDAYNFLKGRQRFVGPLFLHAEFPAPAQLRGEFAEKYQLVQELRSAGIELVITNQPHRAFTNPYGGRSHIKFAIINQRVYLGGCNLDAPEHTDLMLGWDDASFAATLYEFSQQMIRHEGLSFMEGRDRHIKLNDECEVLIDAGRPRQSVILDQALRLIDEAHESVFMTNQFFPHGVTLQHLKAARRRGVTVRVVFSHPANFNKFERLPQYLNLAWAHITTPASLLAGQLSRDKGYIHSKVLTSESAAMVGSHNYISAGVNFGTAEIALVCRNPAFIAELTGVLGDTRLFPASAPLLAE